MLPPRSGTIDAHRDNVTIAGIEYRSPTRNPGTHEQPLGHSLVKRKSQAHHPLDINRE
jgi:hypothetical protein